MHIEELIIDGFKSYSTRVPVGPFDKQFNAITGLNGSGKSNILDSICFVLGISNLSQVRVGNLSELVYKQGQAGVTKASVTVVFNNSDKQRSPVGYEEHDKITITRQIIIGGRNRYLLNSHSVQQNAIQNLFHSVSLNVNNPHFLIMQGRITKVINMKPQETLGMIEEAAGTRMYENKKGSALKTLEKKQLKVDEINRLLSEEITPTLEKLQKERTNYMLWVANNNEIERLERFCIAFEYCQAKHRLENKTQQLENLESSLQMILASITSCAKREKEINKELKDRTATRDTQRGKELKGLDEMVSNLSKEVAAIESKLKNRETDLEGQLENQKQGQSTLATLLRNVAEKDAIAKKEQEKFDVLEKSVVDVKKEIEKAQWSMQALTAGMSAQEAQQQNSGETEGKSLREQLLETQTRLAMMDSEQKKKTMAIQACQERIMTTEQTLTKSKNEGKRLTQEKARTEALVSETRTAIERSSFDVEAYMQLQKTARQGEANLQTLVDQCQSLKAYLGNHDFQYADPYRGFDRCKVKGVVSKLFQIDSNWTSYHRALEVCAGGRLYHVVVDNEETGKALLEHGQLRRRATIIPLNRIVSHTMAEGTVRQAKSVAPPGSYVELALQIIGFEKEVANAMKYVFGNCLICDTPETAKQVTFHPGVRARSVTKDGDVYDPTGTITGGSAPRGGGFLVRLQELVTLEKQVQAQRTEYEKAAKAVQVMQSSYIKFQTLDKELKCKEHELTLINDRINSSEHYNAETSLQEMRTQLTTLESELRNMPEDQKALEKQSKQLEKDIKSLESSREERIKYFEKQVEKLKKSLQDHSQKLDKQREKTEQANVELEVLQNEQKAQEGKDQTFGQTRDTLQAEIDKVKDTLTKKKEALIESTNRHKTMVSELHKLDQTLSKLAAELTKNQETKEEKELEQKKIAHKIQQLQADDKETANVVKRMEKEYGWIERERNFFGKRGTDFDFEANDYQDNKHRLDELNSKQKHLSKNVNKKAMAMFDKAEQEYKDLLQKRDIILKDKHKIEMVIKDLDQKKLQTLERTWVKVNKDFNSIFSTLLTNANAKLEPPQGMAATEGLEIKVGFNGVYKQSLTELSGGQRSLLALSLVLALLLFKPAPMYILDEIDSALDLSHTQNIGHMIRTHFPHSQFIVVSLKEGMFNHANVLFRTRFIDGTSTVARYAIQDGDAPPQDKENEGGNKAAKKRKIA